MMYKAGAYEKYFKLVTLFFTRTKKNRQQGSLLPLSNVKLYL